MLIGKTDAISLSDIFQAMRKLVDYLKKGRIPYYFHHDCNVLWALNDTRKTGMAAWLEKQLKPLEATREITSVEEIRPVWQKAFTLPGEPRQEL